MDNFIKVIGLLCIFVIVCLLLPLAATILAHIINIVAVFLTVVLSFLMGPGFIVVIGILILFFLIDYFA